MATGDQVTVVSAGLDATDYESGARRIEAANQRIEQSTRALENVGERSAARMAETARGFDATVRQMDQAARSAANFAAAERQGIAASEAAASARQRANRELEGARSSYQAVRPVSDGVTDSLRAQQQQTQNLGASFADLFSIVANNGRIFQGLTEDGRESETALGGLGLAFTAVRHAGESSVVGLASAGVALAALGAAAENNQRSLNTMATGLQRTRADYAGAAQQIDAVARRLAETTALTTQQARDALAKLAQVPGIDLATENLMTLAKAAQDLGAAFNQGPVEGAERLAAALRDPMAAVKKYSEDGAEGIRGFDGDFRRHIELLVASGRTTEAAGEVVARFGRTLKGASDNVTPLQTAWRNLAEQMTATANAALGTGDGIGAAITNGLAGAIRALTEAVALFSRLEGLTEGKLGRFLFSPDLGIPELFGENGLSSPPAPGSDTRATGNRRPAMTFAGLPSDIQPLIAAAAQRTGLDPEIMARVYGREAVRDPVTGAFATSPKGAVGAMQILPSTYRELAAKYGLDPAGINDPATNILASGYYLRERLDARGNVPLALADYNAGMGRVDRSGIVPAQYTAAGDLAAPAQVGAPDLARLPRETQAYVRDLTAGYAGTGYAVPGQRVAATPAEAAGLYGPPSPLLPLVVNPADAAADRLAAFNERTGGSDQSRRELLTTRLRTAESDLAGTAEGTREFADRKAMVESLRAELEKIKPAETAFTEAMQRTNAAGQELDPTLRAVREKVAEFDAQMKAAGKTADDPEVIAGRARVVQETLAGLQNAYAQQFDTVQRAATAQERIAAAYALGSAAGEHQTNVERAAEEVRKSGIVGTEARRAAEEALTAAYDRQAAARRAAEGAQFIGRRIQDQGIEMQGIAAQQAMVTAGPRAQADLEATTLATRQLSRSMGPGAADTEAGRQFVENARTIAQMNLDLKQQVNSWHAVESAVGSAIDRMGSATVDLLSTGKWDDFRKAGVSVLLDLQKEFLKLAVLNPIKNAIFGSTQPTLNSLGGGLGRLFGASGSTAPTSFDVTGSGTAGGFSGGYEGLAGGAISSGSGVVISGQGNAFSAGYLIPFAKGGEIVHRPTVFPMADNRTGLMGEAGPEAIMPLKAGPGGKPGVRVLVGGDEIVLPLARASGGDLAVQAFGKGGIAAILGGGLVGAIASKGGLGGAAGILAGGALGGMAMRGGGAAMLLGGAALGSLRGAAGIAALGGAGLTLADDDKRDELEDRFRSPFRFAAGGVFDGGSEYPVGPAGAGTFTMPPPARAARSPAAAAASAGRAAPRVLAQVNMNIKAQDADSFRRSRGQVVATMARSLGAATRRL